MSTPMTTPSEPSREIELKLACPPDALAGLLAHPDLPRAWRRSRLAATYFDTPDLALRKAGLSLRIRKEGRRHIQTLKAGTASAGALFDRREWHTALPRPELDLAAFAQSPLAGVIDGKGGALAPCFEVLVRRRAATIEHGGARIEVAVDEGEIRAGGRERPVCEIELELKDGPPAGLFALARSLTDAALLTLAGFSKSDRGYRLAEGHEPAAVKQRPGPLAPGICVRDAFRSLARDCLAHFQANAPALHEARAPDAVHQSRVALRRLRAALSLFADVVNDGERETVREGLRWLAGALGEARDLDVILARGVPEEAAGPLRERRERAYEQALASAASARASRILVETVAWIETGVWAQDPALDAPAAGFAADLLERRHRKLRKRSRRLRHRSVEERHRLRIALKKLRYAAEFFESLFPGKKAAKRRKTFLSAAEDFQERLGTLNDAAVAAQVLRGLSADDAGSPEPDREGGEEDADAPSPAELDAAVAAGKHFRKAKPFWR